MLEALQRLFSSGTFMPHGMCYLWQPSLLWFHLVSDALIALAYFSIPFTLLYFVRKRKDLQFHWMFVCFAIFIVACGTTHLMEIWVIWHPTYWLSGAIKAITALASVPTAILLVKLIPQALRLPSPAKLEEANAALQLQIADRKRAQEELHRSNEELESRVTERTRQLEIANQNLREEVRGRQRVAIGLRESESRLRAVLDSALNAVVVMDTAGQIIDWNAQAEVVFGWPREQALGRDLAATVIPSRFREAHRNGLQHFLATGEAPMFQRLMQLTALRRDGSEFPIEMRVRPIESADTVSFCAFVTDITEHRRVEEAARSTQALLQAIVDNSKAVIYAKDIEGRYLLVNRRYEEIFHHKREALLGKTDYEVFPRPAADAFRAVDKQVEVAGRALQMEEIAPHDDGPHTYISVKCPLYDSAGRVGGICGISTDITEHKHAERKQRQQLRQLELLHRITRAIEERQDLLSILQVVIRSLEEDWSIDFGCACLYEAMTRTLTIMRVGAKSDPLAQELILVANAQIAIDENGLARCAHGEFVHEPDISAAQSPFLQRLARGGLHSLIAAPLVAASNMLGALIVTRRDANAFSDEDREFLQQLCEHVALAAHQAQLYGDLQCAYEDLRQTQHTVMQQERVRALGQMASGVAHDINNALSPAALYTQSLLEREVTLSERARQYLIVVLRAIEDVTQSVARLREFYRPRETQAAPATVQLNDILDQVIELTRARWHDIPQERGIVIQLHKSFAANLPNVQGWESDIRDALTNLVLNAIDAMPEGGTLTVRSYCPAMVAGSRARESSRPLQVRVEISDTGVGMDEHTRNKCLEPFFTTKGERGTGLGLAMVYGAVERHSGEILIDSELGKGTTMSLQFPAAHLAGQMSDATGAAPRPEHALNILVVDDDPMLLRSLRDILTDDGHHVVVADGGQAGIDAFIAALRRGEPFSAVLSDLGMPYVDGRKVAAAVKAASPATPVILVTGWGQRMQVERDLPANVDRVLTKPPKIRELQQALAELVSRRGG